MQHVMVRSTVEGWFVCAVCGLVAECPGCVAVSGVPAVHVCKEHEHVAHKEDIAHRMVWATKNSAR